MIYRNSNFPILATKRIAVSTSNPDEPKIKVEFLIKSREASSVSRWFSDTFSEYTQYLKIYFMALDDTSAQLVSSLSLPDMRLAQLNALPSLEALGTRYNRAAGSITFSEVLQNESFTTTPVSDLSGDYYHDIYSEVEIDITNLDLQATDKVHLVGFIHMDAEMYYRDKGIVRDPQNIDPIETRGGELIYDLLLQRGETDLEVPLFRDVFYIDSATTDGTALEPYYGPVHYHGEDNPGPGGYIGWMVGPEGMDMGPRLEARSVRNYKVVSDAYQTQMSEGLSFGSLTGNPAASSGDLLESYVNSVVDREELVSHTTRLKEIVNASDFSRGLQANNFIKLSDVPMSYIRSVVTEDPTTGELTSEQSHHGVVVGIDFFRLVRSRSNYGDILNFHNSKGNHAAVAEMLYGSKILNLAVTRERVTNNAHHHCDVGSLQYVEYDTDISEKLLVRTEDGRPRPSGTSTPPLKNMLSPATSQFCTLSEIELLGLTRLPDGTVVRPPLDFDRHFVIKDYDLYHNIQTGKYRHNLEFVVTDGVSTFIRELLALVKGAHENFSRYYSVAQEPVIMNDQGVYQQGSYDYKVNDFHSSFRELVFFNTITVAVRAYRKAVLFLSGQTIPETSAEALANSLDPQNTSLEVLGDFHKTMSTVLSSIGEILEQTGESRAYYDIKKQNKTYVPQSGPGRKSRTIEVKVKGIEVISAITEGALLANYSNFSENSEGERDVTPDTPNITLQNYASRASRFPARIQQNNILPANYLTFAPSPYSTDGMEIELEVSSPRLSSTSKKAKKPISKSSPIIISSHREFSSQSGPRSTNQVLKINSMRSRDSVDSGFINREESSYVYGSFLNAGLSLNPVSNLSSTGVGEGMKLRNPSSIKQKLKDIFIEAKSRNCLDLSDELKATLQAAALNGITREEIASIAEDNYANLNDIRTVLGPAYGSIINLVGSLQTVTNKIAGSAIKAPSEKDKFLGNLRSEGNTSYGLNPVTPYEEERGSFVIVTPGIDSHPITVEEMTEVNTADSDIERYVFLKIQPNKKEDGIISVNDGYLLRV